MNCRVWLCHNIIIITVLVSLLVVLFSDVVIAGDVPANSHVIGNQWYCNSGYRREGNTCVKLAVPDNAWVQGNRWYCNSGYRREGNTCVKLAVPDNAWVQGNRWYCNSGHRREGNTCVKFAVPNNAFVFGSVWVCNQGYKKVGNACDKMTPQEVEQQRLHILAAQARERSEGFIVDDERFTLSEIVRKCEVYRYSENYGDVECSGSKFRIVERKCEAYFSGKFEIEGELECSGSDLRPIERNCTTSMYSDDYADIDC